jgi:hypothetical protein
MNSFTFLFKAMKETHEQLKTKIDIDEFRSGTTNITHNTGVIFKLVIMSCVIFLITIMLQWNLASKH